LSVIARTIVREASNIVEQLGTMFVERRTRMLRMALTATSPALVDPVSAIPAVSVAPMPAQPKPQPVRPRVRRLVVFTGRLS
jgi:hypothetical protein